jgi:hypothetical protein
LVNGYNSDIVDQINFISSKSLRVDISEDEKGISVSHPAIAAGSDGKCLLVYVKDSGIDHCEIVTRVIAEPR